MWTEYNLVKSKSDVMVTFHLSNEIVSDLEARAKALGRTFETEFRLRLVRSLERDNAMDRSDALLDAIFDDS